MPQGSYMTPQGMLVTPQGGFYPPPSFYIPPQMYAGQAPAYMQVRVTAEHMLETNRRDMLEEDRRHAGARRTGRPDVCRLHGCIGAVQRSEACWFLL